MNVKDATVKHSAPKIVGVVGICEGFHELTFEVPTGWVPALPGQFVTIRVSESTTPLLRRPFAFSHYDRTSGRAAIIFQKRGPATEILAGKAVGDRLDIIGPLGKQFPELEGTSRAILVAGGIGLGPMLFLDRHLRSCKRDVVLVYGCARKALVPQGKCFTRANAIVCTEDGSLGFRGTNVDYVREMPAGVVKGSTLYCCGPNRMMKACHEFACGHGLRCYVSMEQVMACGVGACMGCAVELAGERGYARVCTEGPVFDSREVAW